MSGLPDAQSRAGRADGSAPPRDRCRMSKEDVMLKRLRHQAVSEALRAYVGWREACLRLEDAYAAWRSPGGRRSAVAFLDYTAALDHEEQTARAYAGCIRPIAATQSVIVPAA